MKSTFWMTAEQAKEEIKRRGLSSPRKVLVAVLLRHAIRHLTNDDTDASGILRAAYESVSPYTEVTL